MRTKALFGLAALAVGALTAFGQVYSLNVVGYVNVDVPTGYTLIANPLNGTDNTVSNLFSAVPETSKVKNTVWSWNGTYFVGNTYDEFDLKWQTPGDVYAPGDGFFIQNPNAPYTLTLVGEVLQGSLTVSLPAQGGYKLVSSKVPQEGYVEDLGLVPGLGDVIYLWNGSYFVAITNDEFDDKWGAAPPFDVDPVKGPKIGVGKSFFFRNSANTATWNRTFTVQ